MQRQSQSVSSQIQAPSARSSGDNYHYHKSHAATYRPERGPRSLSLSVGALALADLVKGASNWPPLSRQFAAISAKRAEPDASIWHIGALDELDARRRGARGPYMRPAHI